MSDPQFGALCAFLSSCTWAMGTAVYSRLTRTHSAFAVNLARSLFAFPIFLAVAFAVGRDFGEVHFANATWFLISTVASYGLGDAVFLLSTASLGVPGALAISSCYPIWTTLLGWTVDHQRLGPGQLLGLALTLAGVAAVILFSPASRGGSEGTGALPVGEAKSGDLSEKITGEFTGKLTGKLKRRLPIHGAFLAVLTSLFWAMNGYSVFRGGHGISMSTANAIRMAFAIVLSPLIARVLAPGRPMLLPWGILRRWTMVFVVEAFGGSAFFVYGMVHSPLAVGATLSALAPVISVPVSLALGLEKFSLGRTVGVAMAVIGLRFLVN